MFMVLSRGKLSSLIKNEVNKELLYISESYRGFNLKFFKTLKNIKQLNDYAKKHLIVFKSGGTRTVYGYKSGKVLKIIHKEDTLGQNKTEIGLCTSKKIPNNFLVKIYDYDHKNYFWILEEAVKVFEDNHDILNKLNINGSFLLKFLKNIQNDEDDKTNLGLNKILNKTNTDKIDFNYLDFEIIKKFYILTKYYHALDIYNIEHWGITINGNIVVVDYGVFYNGLI